MLRYGLKKNDKGSSRWKCSRCRALPYKDWPQWHKTGSLFTDSIFNHSTRRTKQRRSAVSVHQTIVRTNKVHPKSWKATSTLSNSSTATAIHSCYRLGIHKINISSWVGHFVLLVDLRWQWTGTGLFCVTCVPIGRIYRNFLWYQKQSRIVDFVPSRYGPRVTKNKKLSCNNLWRNLPRQPSKNLVWHVDTPKCSTTRYN